MEDRENVHDALSDADVQRFVVSGFLTLPPSIAVPPSAHTDIAANILACGLQEAGDKRDPYGLRQLDGDAAGNNIIHAAPGLLGPAFLESPTLIATLTRLLGPGYRLHAHCRGHLRQRSAKTSMWHVDAYKGLPWCSGRHHEPHWLMIMYYPQDTTHEMGPTQLLPGSQYYRGDSDRAHYSRGHIPDFGEQQAGWATTVHTVVGAAGTIVVMHYDLWHRALASASDAPRLMLKFVACRTAPPAPFESPASRPRPVPCWPLAERGGELPLEDLVAEPLLHFLAGAPSEPSKPTNGAFAAADLPPPPDGERRGRHAKRGARRFDRQVASEATPRAAVAGARDAGPDGCGTHRGEQSSNAASAAGSCRAAGPCGATGPGGGGSVAAGLPQALISALETHLAEAVRAGCDGDGRRKTPWQGSDLLSSKGLADAEKALFASAVAVAKRAAAPTESQDAAKAGSPSEHARPAAYAVPAEHGSGRDTSSACDGKRDGVERDGTSVGVDGAGAGVATAATGVEGPPVRLEKQQMPFVLAWLAPRCAWSVRVAADRERRLRFVADRAPIWWHVWSWLHGSTSAISSVSTPTTAGRSAATPAGSGATSVDGSCRKHALNGGGIALGSEAHDTATDDAATDDADHRTRQLMLLLLTAAEPTRLCAAYALAQLPGAVGVASLLDALTADGVSTSVRRTALYGLISAGARAPSDALTALVLQQPRPAADTTAAQEAAPRADASPPLPAASGNRAIEPADPSLGMPIHDSVDPILSMPIHDSSRWISASSVRVHEGYDAECLLAATDRRAEARYFGVLALIRSGCGELPHHSELFAALRQLGHPCRPPPSACLVLLEALGADMPRCCSRGAIADGCAAQEAAAPTYGASSRSLLHERVVCLASSLTHAHADAGTRAVAARALAQLAARRLLGETTAACVAATALAAALATDADRYVRGYAADGLASLLLCHARADSTARAAIQPPSTITTHESSAPCEAAAVAQSALSAAISAKHVDAAIHKARDAREQDTAARWLCARRRCPLTSPSSPY